jgi:hypothetical protein
MPACRNALPPDTGGEAGKTFARRHRDTMLSDEVAPWAATDTILAGSTDVGTFPASSIPLWAMEVRPWLTSCQLCSGVPTAKQGRAAGGQPARAQAGAGRTSLPLPDSGGGETVGFTNKRIAVAARTFPASSIPLWAMEVRPWLTSCQLCRVMRWRRGRPRIRFSPAPPTSATSAGKRRWPNASVAE